MPDLETSTVPELLQSKTRSRRRHHHRRFRFVRRITRPIRKLNWRAVFAVVLTLVAVLVMSGLVLASNARNEINDSWSSLERILNTVNNTPGTDLTLADFERLQVGVTDLSNSLTSAKRQTIFLRPFAPLYADLHATLESLDIAQELVLAANDVLTGMQPTLFFLTQGEENETVVPQLSSGERIVELLTLGRGRFLSAQNHLVLAQQEIDALDLERLSPDMLITVDGMRQQYDYLREVNSTLLDAPDLLTLALGTEDIQTYLVLSQNSDELRPSGGYISTYGWMTVRNGRVMNYNYSPTTVTSPNPPPASMASEISVPDWWLRYGEPIYAAWDGSWYADFPSTASMAAWYYDNGHNPESPVNGVIGIDIVGFEYLLEGLGSVTVPEYRETVTPDTFREAVYRIRAEGAADSEHKTFVAALYRQIISDWQNASQEQNQTLRGSILRALQEKHIMLYFKDESLNRAASLLGWSGEQDDAVGNDYLMVADANIGSKSSRSVIRQTTYDVQIQPDGTVQGRASIAYDFSARVAEQDPAVRPAHYGSDINYNNLFQVFVPAQSVLIETNNLDPAPTVVSTDEHTLFTALVRIEYNQSERYQFSYTTPVLVETMGPYRRYKLLLQKQPGTIGELANVQVTLPPGAEPISVSPEPAASYHLDQSIIEFRVELLTDQWIEVIYSQP